MTALRLPCTIFKTQKRMDDYGADDMRYGDLTESQLKNEFHLLDVSTRVDPYTLMEITPFRQPHSRFYGSRGAGENIPLPSVPLFFLMKCATCRKASPFMAHISILSKR